MPQKSPPTALEQTLKLNYQSEPDNVWLTSQHTLRVLVGVLGMLLPLLLWLTVLIDTKGYITPLDSISHYYYTRANSIFVLVVSVLAIFLLIYKGKDPIDFYLSSIAGLFALCVVLFPTSNISDICQDKDNICSVTILKPSGLRKSFHYFSAGIFLGCLAYISLFIFTRSDRDPEDRTQAKKIRNRIFRTCGIIMFMAIAVIGV
jgi:hypothetical protein